MAIIIEWIDGTIDTAESPEEILEVIAADQWNDYGPEEMRRVLSDRAWNMWQRAIDPELSLSEFFRKMEEAGLCQIIEWSSDEEA